MPASLVGGRFRFRWSWTDVLVVTLTILVAASASHAVDRRPAINLAWEWVALGLIYLLLRNLPRTRDESSVLAGALVATAVAVSAYGLYQVKVELPLLQAEFQRDPGRILEKLNIAPGTHGEVVLKNRLVGSNEVWSTFALANSLAGYHRRPMCRGTGRRVLELAAAATRRDRDGPALAMAAPVVLVLLICLIATKSRSAWLGLWSAWDFWPGERAGTYLRALSVHGSFGCRRARVLVRRRPGHGPTRSRGR